MARVSNFYYEYDRFKNYVSPLNWDDIKEGETYYIPPTIIYGRRDFICEEKTPTCLKGRAYEYETKEWSNATIYKSELSMRFMVKKER